VAGDFDAFAAALASAQGGGGQASTAAPPRAPVSGQPGLDLGLGLGLGGDAPTAARPRAAVPGDRPGAGRTRVCVVGHEGVAAATAGHLALLGVDVAWTSARSGSLAAYAERGGVELVGGVVSGSGRPRLEPSLDRAVRGADLVVLCTHATEHAAYATLLAPVLADGQVVLLTPGRTGGALEFARRLAAVACRARIVLGETETAVYVPMGQGPGRVEILVEKLEIRAAAFPATDTSRLLDVLHGLYPQVAAAESVLDTSIANVGGVVHPAAMLLNPQVTEQAAAGADLVYYQDQVNRTLADLVMEPLDAERVAVGRALGLRSVPTFVEWSRACFGTAGADIRETVSTNPAYAGFKAPTHLLALGFVTDEVPNSLVPLEGLGAVLGVPTPTTSAIVDLAAAMCRIDFRAHGRTLDRLGLDGLDAAGMREHVAQGDVLGACGVAGVCRPLPQFA
jgi:opine dehydrogenase